MREADLAKLRYRRLPLLWGQGRHPRIFEGSEQRKEGEKEAEPYIAVLWLTNTVQVLEYCSFVPGVFMDYLGPPEKLSTNLSHTQQFVDFKNCRAILPEDSDATVSFTTVGDVAKLVTKALSYEGEWPTVGGVACNKITLSELLELGEKIRGTFYTHAYVFDSESKLIVREQGESFPWSESSWMISKLEN